MFNVEKTFSSLMGGETGRGGGIHMRPLSRNPDFSIKINLRNAVLPNTP
jgi:hypothetical protein